MTTIAKVPVKRIILLLNIIGGLKRLVKLCVILVVSNGCG